MGATLAAASLALIAAQPAAAPLEFPLGSVEGLLGACSYEGEVQAEIEYHFGTCIGFIRGVRVALETLGMARGEPFVCPPGGVTVNGDMRDAVVAELRSGAHQPGDVSTPAIVNALRRLYPCPEPQVGGSRPRSR